MEKLLDIFLIRHDLIVRWERWVLYFELKSSRNNSFLEQNRLF